MSAHIEWTEAATPVEVVGRGAEVGEGIVTAERCLILGDDPALAVEGTADELLALLGRARNAILETV